MIFSRKRGSGRHAAPKRERDDFDDVVDTDDDETTSARDVGPYDIDDVSGDPEGLASALERLDLGWAAGTWILGSAIWLAYLVPLFLRR